VELCIALEVILVQLDHNGTENRLMTSR